MTLRISRLLFFHEVTLQRNHNRGMGLVCVFILADILLVNMREERVDLQNRGNFKYQDTSQNINQPLLPFVI